jgi:predicted AAA+ superfamily ATPase
MIQRLPAWGETQGKRLSAHPKVHVIDSGLAGWLLGLSAAKINSRNPAALTEFGHLVETFAAGEILKQVGWADEVITASHFRTEAGDEVDVVLETWDGRVAGFEIKAGTRIKDPDLNGLRQKTSSFSRPVVPASRYLTAEATPRKCPRCLETPVLDVLSPART